VGSLSHLQQNPILPIVAPTNDEQR
jgi:hypothetical protein